MTSTKATASERIRSARAVSMRETIEEVASYIVSPRFALTAEDVRTNSRAVRVLGLTACERIRILRTAEGSRS
jgi:hypothetical protein